jgi:hypothetical protein
MSGGAQPVTDALAAFDRLSDEVDQGCRLSIDQPTYLAHAGFDRGFHVNIVQMFDMRSNPNQNNFQIFHSDRSKPISSLRLHLAPTGGGHSIPLIVFSSDTESGARFAAREE